MARYLGRFRSTDMIGARAVPIRGRDQEAEEEPEGELICRVMQTGADTWAGHDGKGRVLRIKRGRDGALEIRHMAETGADEADPDIVGTYPAGTGQGEGGDPSRAARVGTGDAMSRWVRTGKWEHHIPALAAYQKRLDDYYGNK